MSNPARQSDYISEARDLTRQLWDAINGLAVLQREWNALDYGNTLTEFSGQNESLSAPEIGAVVFDSANAMVAVLNAGHATNISKLL